MEKNTKIVKKNVHKEKTIKDDVKRFKYFVFIFLVLFDLIHDWSVLK